MAKAATAKKKTGAKKGKPGRPSKASGVNKSAEIRKIAVDNPGAGPTEIAKITAARINTDVSAALVSNVLGARTKKKKVKRKKAENVRRSPVGDNTPSGLKSAFEFVNRVGGIDEAKKYLSYAEIAHKAVVVARPPFGHE